MAMLFDALKLDTLGGWTDAQVEKARRWSEKTIDAFWVCLQNEVQNQLASRMKSEDFALYIKGACLQEAQAFRVPFVDYLTMKFPDIDVAAHLAQSTETIEQWRNAAIKLYVEELSKKETPIMMDVSALRETARALREWARQVVRDAETTQHATSNEDSGLLSKAAKELEEAAGEIERLRLARGQK
jgi:hypothetical protein